MTRPSVPQSAQTPEPLEDLYERACDLADAERHADAEVLFRQLPHGGMLHRTYRRQLNRAHRRRIRKAAT